MSARRDPPVRGGASSGVDHGEDHTRTTDTAAAGRGPVAEETSARRPMKWRTRGIPPFGMAVAIVLVYPFASLMFRLRYRHAERIPARGPVLVVANHVSIL